MSYQANVYKVMIASPSDVATERQIVRDVIHEWNAINSEDKGIVLSPVGWETHSTPQLGDRAQSLINKQVLAACDLLIAVFWTRVGTPTGESISGTVEEIEEHVKAGKPAMIYFSNAPVVMDSVDPEQYAKLKEFKAICYAWGLVETYDSISQFRDKLGRQLAQTIINNDYFALVSGLTITLPAKPQVPVGLSAEAAELLTAASQDKNGNLLMLGTMQGLTIQANRKTFGETGDRRSEAKWKEAVRELCNKDLVEDRGHKGEIFGVTNEGYRVAETLASSDPDHLSVDLETMRGELHKLECMGQRHFTFGIHPTSNYHERWNRLQDVEKAVEESCTRSRSGDQVPPCQKGNLRRQWGIANQTYGEPWLMTKKGIFLHKVTMNLNSAALPGHEQKITEGNWVDLDTCRENIFNVMQFFKNLSTKFGELDDVRLEITAPTNGLYLVSFRFKRDLFLSQMEPCSEPEYSFKKQLKGSDFHHQWVDVCTDAIDLFVELFPSVLGLEIPTSRDWVDTELKRSK